MSVYRILDASLNRATEGLRTLEEYTRFICNDAPLSAQLKQIRHDLMMALNNLPRTNLIQARDTPGDVGTQIQTTQEYSRTNLHEVIVAAVARTQQALRCLEEYSKTLESQISGDAAASVEQIRYRFYSLGARVEQKAIEGDSPESSSELQRRRKQLNQSHLYALITTGDSDQALTELIKTLAAAGVDLFQLRDPKASDRLLFERACLAARVAKETKTLLIINDRADIAIASDSDGVHVGQDELPAQSARQVIGHDRLLGISTHDLAQARQAIRDEADYIGCGPIFPGNTKTFTDYAGPAFLQAIVDAEMGLPAFAIGGIDLSNVQQVIATGCRRIAVTGALRDSDHPAATAKNLKGKLNDV